MTIGCDGASAGIAAYSPGIVTGDIPCVMAIAYNKVILITANPSDIRGKRGSENISHIVTIVNTNVGIALFIRRAAYPSDIRTAGRSLD
jgi:hypothetical protein